VGITLRQFEQMKDRVARPTSVPPLAVTRAGTIIGQIVLGIDPSLRGTGFGIIQVAKPIPETLVHGTIACPATWVRSRCLAKIFQTVRDAVRRHQPTVCVVEGLFYAQNMKTALIMGEARGAAMAAVAEAGIEIYEIAPRKVKQAVVGYGGAQKSAVAKMVQRMLNLSDPPAPDAADALALALAHAQQNGRYSVSTPKRI